MHPVVLDWELTPWTENLPIVPSYYYNIILLYCYNIYFCVITCRICLYMYNVKPTSVVIRLTQRTLRASPITPERICFLAQLWKLHALLYKHFGLHQRDHQRTSHALIVDTKQATSVMVVQYSSSVDYDQCYSMLKRGCQQTIWTREHLELHCVQYLLWDNAH